MVYEYYKSRLNTQERQAYETILASIRARKSTAYLGAMDSDRGMELYYEVCNDHPELFAASHYISCKWHNNGWRTESELQISYLYSEQQERQYRREIERVLQQLHAQIRTRDEKAIERAVCDYLIEHVEYQLNDMYHQNAAAALVGGKAQCSGIARAAKWLFDDFGIKCIYITGRLEDEESGEDGPHAWNIIYINGQCYHLDVTSMIGCNPTREKPYYYCDYNETDDEIGENHYWKKSDTPRCLHEYINEAMPNQIRLDTIASMNELEWELMRIDIKDGLVVIFELDMDGSKQMLANRITDLLRKVFYKRGINMGGRVSIIEEQATLIFEE